MAKEIERPPYTRFAGALRGFCQRHGKADRGAQTWLVEKCRKTAAPKTPGQISSWWYGPLVPGEQAFEEFLAALDFDPDGQKALRDAWEKDRDDQAHERREKARARALGRAEPRRPRLFREPETSHLGVLGRVARNLDERHRRDAARLLLAMATHPKGWGKAWEKVYAVLDEQIDAADAKLAEIPSRPVELADPETALSRLLDENPARAAEVSALLTEAGRVGWDRAAPEILKLLAGLPAQIEAILPAGRHAKGETA